MTKKLTLALAFALLLLIPALLSAQGRVRYYPGTNETILLPNGDEVSPSLGFTAQPGTGLYKSAQSPPEMSFSLNGTRAVRIGSSYIHVMPDNGSIVFRVGSSPLITSDAPDVLALRNGGSVGFLSPQAFNVYNFCDSTANNCATGYERLATFWSGSVAYLKTQNAGTGVGQPLVIQGSKPKVLTDGAAAVSFVRVPVPTNGNTGGKVIYTATSTDGASGSLTSHAEYNFAGADIAGTVTCGVSAQLGVATAYARANTLICTVTPLTSTTNCDLQVTCTDNKAAAQTITFNWSLIMPIPTSVTPQ